MKKKLLAAVLTGMMLLQVTAPAVFADEAAGAAGETAEETADEAEIEEADSRFGTGTVDGQTYTQDFFGFSVALDGDWAFANEEDLEAMGNTLMEMGTDEVKEAIDSGTSYLDMYAENGTTFQTVNVTIAKLSMLAALQFKNNKSKAVGDMLVDIKPQIEQMGFSNAEITQDEIEFLGETVPCIRILSYPEQTGGDIALYQTQVYIQSGSYLCTLTASSYIEDTSQDIFAYCSEI